MRTTSGALPKLQAVATRVKRDGHMTAILTITAKFKLANRTRRWRRWTTVGQPISEQLLGYTISTVHGIRYFMLQGI